jgi:hypothetical protein
MLYCCMVGEWGKNGKIKFLCLFSILLLEHYCPLYREYVFFFLLDKSASKLRQSTMLLGRLGARPQH